MKRTFTLLLVASASINAALALNLQPGEITVEKDGPPVRRYFFRDESKQVLFHIDSKMSVSGSTNQAVFTFEDIRNAKMRLTTSGVPPQTPFDEKNLELYRTAMRGFVPPAATNVQITEEKSDAVPINGWTSHQFVLSYKLFSFPYRQSVTFLNYSATQQLVFDVAAPEADYEKAYARGYRVLNSLSDYVPSREAGPT